MTVVFSQVRRPAIALGISRVGPPASGLRPPVCLCPWTPKRGSSLCCRGNFAIIKGLNRTAGKGQVGCNQQGQEEVADFWREAERVRRPFYIENCWRPRALENLVQYFVEFDAVSQNAFCWFDTA